MQHKMIPTKCQHKIIPTKCQHKIIPTKCQHKMIRVKYNIKWNQLNANIKWYQINAYIKWYQQLNAIQLNKFSLCVMPCTTLHNRHRRNHFRRWNEAVLGTRLVFRRPLSWNSLSFFQKLTSKTVLF